MHFLYFAPTNAMSQPQNRNRWIEAGFELFAQEGLEGIQVERLSRILKLNKSGYYHYFGNPERYQGVLMRHMHKQADLMVTEIRACAEFDPGFLHLMVKHKLTILATMQLVRNRNVPMLMETYREVTHKIDTALLPLWAEYIGLAHNQPLALRYFEMIRDMFFSRITENTLHYDFLVMVATEAKALVLDLNRT